METVKEEIIISDKTEDLEVDAKPLQDEHSDSDAERVSGLDSFRRNSKMTRSLPVKYAQKLPRQRAPSMESVATGRSGGFFGGLFNNNKKDAQKDQILQLQTELDQCKAQAQRDSTTLKTFREENEKLEKDNIVLNNVNLTLERRNLKLAEKNKSLQKWTEDILSSVGQVLTSYGEIFANFDLVDFQCNEYFKTVDNLQIGSGNTQNILNVDMEDLNRQFSQHHKHLENLIKELKETKYNLQLAKSLQKQMGDQILTLENVLEEMKEALMDVRGTKKQDVSMDLLDYTISWTDPRLMAECVDELHNLPDRLHGYKFNDLKGKAKVGVLRICKKYENRMNYKRFVQRLEMEDNVSEEKMAADTPLQKDDCASLLVKWVKLQEGNDANALIERFPRIKPGTSDTRRDRAVFPFSNVYSTESLNSNEEFSQKTEQLRERLTNDFKNIVQQEVHMLKPKLEEIKSAIVAIRTEPQFV